MLTNRAEQAPLWKQQNSPPPLSILHQLPHFKTLKRTCVSIIAKFNFCCRLALNLLFSSLPYMIGKVVISFNNFPIFTNSVLQQCIRLLQNVKNYKYKKCMKMCCANFPNPKCFNFFNCQPIRFCQKVTHLLVTSNKIISTIMA